MKNFKHLQTFESFVKEQDMMDEGFSDFARNIGRKMGVLELTDEEISKKANEILQNEDKILSAIKQSSNPSLHMSNYNMLKNKENKIPFYKFVIFLNDNIAELVNKRPLYYEIDNLGVKDTRILAPINPVGT